MTSWITILFKDKATPLSLPEVPPEVFVSVISWFTEIWDETKWITFGVDTSYGIDPLNVNGAGLNGVWATVAQEQVELQVQGAGVKTVDIYASNGVIHVLDTVITE